MGETIVEASLVVMVSLVVLATMANCLAQAAIQFGSHQEVVSSGMVLRTISIANPIPIPSEPNI